MARKAEEAAAVHGQAVTADRVAAPAGGGVPILCVINEVWFFRSHFLPWAQAANRDGFAVSVLGAPEGDAAPLETGVTFLPSSSRRSGWRPRGLWAAARELKGFADQLRPAVVHVFGLHGMAIAALARLAGMRRPLAISITGLGALATVREPARTVARTAAAMVARYLDGARPVWLCENPADAADLRLGRAGVEGRLTVLTGAGVDTERFAPTPQPGRPPLRLVLVARMVRSKGIDLAVEALARARSRGVDVTLSLVGGPDAANPRAIRADDIAAFARVEGVAYHGRRMDIDQLLSDHHVFILPSRGGEGLPKALLEAAAAGRPAIVTDVPGCRDFVVDGVSGFVVPAEDVEALAEAICRASRADLDAMGLRARDAVERGATIEAVTDAVLAVYRSLANRGRPS